MIIIVSHHVFKETGHVPYWVRREHWAKDCWAGHFLSPAPAALAAKPMHESHLFAL